MNMDIGTLTAFAGIATILVALIAIWVEGRRWRLQFQIDLLLRLSDKFAGSDIRIRRKYVAKKLLESKDINLELFYELLDFFTILGILVERKALPFDLCYRWFEYWIVRYWYFAERHVIGDREAHNDPELWSTMERLASKLLVYRRQRHLPEITENEAQRFLREEENL